jgi:hypothetical protein
MVGGFVHLTIALSMFVLAMALAQDRKDGDGGDETVMQTVMLCGQIVVIWFVHCLPICVQRMNRGRLYFAIADLRKRRQHAPDHNVNS